MTSKLRQAIMYKFTESVSFLAYKEDMKLN